MTISELTTKKIAILGIGVNNQAMVRVFEKSNLDFKIFENWKNLQDIVSELSNYDVIFRSPGVPYLSDEIQKLKNQGIEIYSQTKLFYDLCPAKIIGVTGTKGKGTTSVLITEILKKAGRKVWLAGNIGRDPFEFLGEIKDDDWVVLELSSFQLQDLHKSPHIAVVLKIASEHLDYHKDRLEYIDAKKNIVRHQSSSDFAVLNYDLEVTRGFSAETDAKAYWNSVQMEVRPGSFVRGNDIILATETEERKIMSVQDVGLIGWFNLENVTAAIAGCAAAGVVDEQVVSDVVKSFRGLEHRLEFVAELDGVKFYNDSFSTTPETAIAAISAFEEPIIMIIGGSEKYSNYSELAHKISESKVKALLPIGITGPKIAEMARNSGYMGRIIDIKFKDMKEITNRANDIASSGDIVLLSPASASFDMFENYKQRGELFRACVKDLKKGE